MSKSGKGEFVLSFFSPIVFVKLWPLVYMFGLPHVNHYASVDSKFIRGNRNVIDKLLINIFFKKILLEF